MFLVALLEISACLSYISMFACFAHECVNSALVVVLTFVVFPGFDKLQYCVLVFKCYFEVCMFKEIGYFPDLGATVCKGNPFLFVCTVVCFMVRFVVLYLVLEFIYSFVREVVIAGDV